LIQPIVSAGFWFVKPLPPRHRGWYTWRKGSVDAGDCGDDRHGAGRWIQDRCRARPGEQHHAALPALCLV